MKRLAAGILAHVDSGKTTLSEGLLYCAGEIKKLGRVDHGDAFLDTHKIERDKGITIFSKQAVMNFKDAQITLLDTPGHVDFSTETERTLQVLDYAVLVISGTDGVQNHTETLWKLLERYNIPVFLFINKMDISEKSEKELIAELKSRLSDNCMSFHGRGSAWNEEAAMHDELLMEEFIENEALSDSSIAAAIRRRNIFPCFFGSALKLDKVDVFLSCFYRYTLPPQKQNQFGARVFKISEDENGVRLTHMKITGGSLKVKSILSDNAGKGNEWSQKADRIRVYSGAKYTVIDEAKQGTICAVSGLDYTYPGEGLGFEKDNDVHILEPVLTYRIELLDGTDVHTALTNLKKLEEEEPQLHVIWNERLAEIHIQLMGEVQLEVLKLIIKDRFGMEVEFGQGSIAYKETISEPAEGVGHYEPLRHYAEVHLLLEPGERGSGLVFKSDCSEDFLDKNWQRLVLTHLAERTHIGVLTGSPITDMKITLISGKAHQKHTEGGDFRQATYRAVRNGLMNAKSVLLEPWYKFRLEVPMESTGRAMTDISRMGGEFSAPASSGETTVINGSCPVSSMRDYHAEVVSYTHGKGRLSCSLMGYEPCRNSDEIISEIGYDAESDVENTADSVFCSHDAGFVVKWDKVKDYMHLDGIDEKEENTKEQQVRSYINKIADDDELMRIFERTYGTVRKNIPSSEFMRTKKTAAAKKYKASPLPSGPEYLIVDGYNIIFSWDSLREIAKQSLEAARSALTDRLCNYCGFKQCEVILVFDAYKVKGQHREVEKVHNINVVYTKEAETADMYIEKVTKELSKKHRVRVATSDGLEQLIILGNGAIRVSASEFEAEVEELEEQIRKFIISEK